MKSVVGDRIGARLVRAMLAGGAVVGIVAASMIGLNDLADDLALAPHAPAADAANQSPTEI